VVAALGLTPEIRVALAPAVALPQHAIAVEVSGVPGTGATDVALVGATTWRGRRQPWIRVRHGRATLPPPALVGSYPVVVRRSGRTFRSAAWLLRVVPSDARRHRTFATPEAAARAWVGRLPGRRVLVASRHWHRTALDRRDRRLNALLVIAYAPRGDTRPSDRRGVFLAVARDRAGGRWRLLQASVAPYGSGRR
jgi:hypothetical protein